MFKVGDKIECVDNDNSFLTLGQIYTVHAVSPKHVDLSTETGYSFLKFRFINVTREHKLKRILDGEI